MPVHLEQHLAEARLEGSEPAVEPTPSRVWDTAALGHEWRAVDPPHPDLEPVAIERRADAIRLSLDERHRWSTHAGQAIRLGGIVTAHVGDRREWANAVVEARTDRPAKLAVGFGRRHKASGSAVESPLFRVMGDWTPLVPDGESHRYSLRLDWSHNEWDGTWEELGLVAETTESSWVEILDLRLVSRTVLYSEPFGVSLESRQGEHRRTIYSRAPSALTFSVDVPPGGRFDMALGIAQSEEPVTFRLAVASGGEESVLFEEQIANDARWTQRSVDLRAWAGRRIDLRLATEAGRAGSLAFWGSPTLSGSVPPALPNVLFYVIDGAGAAYMSLYGYSRQTTPHLAQLAQEGTLFEDAYSNSSWSKTSTPSFMTSLHHSVLGGYGSDSDPLPGDVTTMVEHFHRAGYQTAVLTSNPYAGRISSLDRGVDLIVDTEKEEPSSVVLGEHFRRWRAGFPGRPFFVHFQTMDVHWPATPKPPFAGRFADPHRAERFLEEQERLAAASGLPGPTFPSASSYPREAFEETGIDRQAFFETVRDLYDESMAQTDAEIGRLVESLRASGEWERTIFVLASDHGHGHGLDLLPEGPAGARYYDYSLRIPLLVVWPGRVQANRRVAEPVSMIDVLPTLLELVDLPQPELAQGRSLAPVLLGGGELEPRPVIFDEFYRDTEGLLEGEIQTLERRWIAHLAVDEAETADGSPFQRLLLFDRSNPEAGNVAEEHSEVARSARRRLEALWHEHRALGRRLVAGEGPPMEPEQIERLRALGYID